MNPLLLARPPMPTSRGNASALHPSTSHSPGRASPPLTRVLGSASPRVNVNARITQSSDADHQPLTEDPVRYEEERAWLRACAMRPGGTNEALQSDAPTGKGRPRSWPGDSANS